MMMKHHSLTRAPIQAPGAFDCGIDRQTGGSQDGKACKALGRAGTGKGEGG